MLAFSTAIYEMYTKLGNDINPLNTNSDENENSLYNLPQLVQTFK